MTPSTLELDQNSVFHAVQGMYEDVASCPNKEFHFPTGRDSCLNIGYSTEELNTIPAAAVESFAGVGYPFLADVIKESDTILDIGSGSGVDVLVAAQKTGPNGKVFGLDITPAMITKARRNIALAGVENIKIMEGSADQIPLEKHTVDIVTSNGVINLVPDKAMVFKEIYRILKPGGRLQIADIVLNKPVSEKSKSNAQLWAECIVGAEPVDVYIDLIRSTGFKNVTVIDRLDYFSRSSNDATKKAAKGLGAHTIVLTGIKE